MCANYLSYQSFLICSYAFLILYTMPTTADNKASERKVVTILFSPQAKQEGERARQTFATVYT